MSRLTTRRPLTGGLWATLIVLVTILVAASGLAVTASAREEDPKVITLPTECFWWDERGQFHCYAGFGPPDDGSVWLNFDGAGFRSGRRPSVTLHGGAGGPLHAEDEVPTVKQAWITIDGERTTFPETGAPDAHVGDDIDPFLGRWKKCPPGKDLVHASVGMETEERGRTLVYQTRTRTFHCSGSDPDPIARPQRGLWGPREVLEYGCGSGSLKITYRPVLHRIERIKYRISGPADRDEANVIWIDRGARPRPIDYELKHGAQGSPWRRLRDETARDDDGPHNYRRGDGAITAKFLFDRKGDDPGCTIDDDINGQLRWLSSEVLKMEVPIGPSDTDLIESTWPREPFTPPCGPPYYPGSC